MKIQLQEMSHSLSKTLDLSKLRELRVTRHPKGSPNLQRQVKYFYQADNQLGRPLPHKVQELEEKLQSSNPKESR